MSFVNPPAESPRHMTHHTFFSQLLKHEVGYNLYLPPEYKSGSERFPVVYHIHGWTGNESSEICPLEQVCSNRRAITVFVNAISSEEAYFDALLQIETILIKELIPHVEGRYRTDKSREGRMLSGFSMGGNMAFYYAVKRHELFGSVTAYAGTYHHLYHKEYRTVGVPQEKIGDMYEAMMREQWDMEENSILSLVREKAGEIRGKLKIDMHIGTADILLCDNEIMHRYLDSLSIPHKYRKYEGMDHDLAKIR